MDPTLADSSEMVSVSFFGENSVGGPGRTRKHAKNRQNTARKAGIHQIHTKERTIHCFLRMLFYVLYLFFTVFPPEKSRNFTSTSGYQSLKTTPAPHVTALIRQLRLARNACKLPSNLGAACWAQYLKVQVNIL